jgi:hypothetical protein
VLKGQHILPAHFCIDEYKTQKCFSQDLLKDNELPQILRNK